MQLYPLSVIYLWLYTWYSYLCVRTHWIQNIWEKDVCGLVFGSHLVMFLLRFTHYSKVFHGWTINSILIAEICHFHFSRYIEASKARLYRSEYDSDAIIAQAVLLYIFENILKLLHPFMPFVTEELWQVRNFLVLLS